MWFVAITFLFGVFLLLSCYDTKHFKGLEPDEDDTIAKKFFHRCYYAANHLTTGTGDITPRTFRAKILTFIFFFLVVIEMFAYITRLSKI